MYFMRHKFNTQDLHSQSTWYRLRLSCAMVYRFPRLFVLPVLFCIVYLELAFHFVMAYC
jgi:hypothetical protein